GARRAAADRHQAAALGLGAHREQRLARRQAGVRAHQRVLQPVRCAAAAEVEGGQPGLHPALALHEVPAEVAGVDVLPGLLLLGLRQLSVEQRADAGAEVPAEVGADHARPAVEMVPGSAGPAYRSRPAVGARWASASRSMARPRWIRERTVPSLASMMSAISWYERPSTSQSTT